MTTPYYRQTQNECAGAAVLHAIGWPIHATSWHPIKLADAACLIDPFPHNDTRKGGTTITACLQIAQKHNLILRYAPIGQNLDLLNQSLARGQRAVGNIPSGIQTAGREINHAVCITSAVERNGRVVGYRVYDPSMGHDARVLRPEAFQFETHHISRGLWLLDVISDGICYDLHKKTKMRQYLVAGVAVLLAIATLYIIL